MPVTPRQAVVGLTCASWIAVLAYSLWLSNREPAPCKDVERITTEADALEFGKYFLRHNSWFWDDSFRSIAELNRELSKEMCCSVQHIDPEDNEGREWNVALRFYAPKGDYEYGYGVQFTSCRHHIVADHWTERR